MMAADRIGRPPVNASGKSFLALVICGFLEFNPANQRRGFRTACTRGTRGKQRDRFSPNREQ